MSRFSECLAFVLKTEGGYSDQKDDRGGPTNYGITQKTYSQWLASNKMQVEPVKYITKASAEAIYKSEYWDTTKCGQLPAPVDLLVFDSAINHGPQQAVKFLQRSVGAKDDGVIGPQTVAAVNNRATVPGAKMIASSIIDQRHDFYHDLVKKDATQRMFLNGWINRLCALEDEVDK